VSRAVQTPGPASQLTARYAVKGALGLRLDEVIVPVEVIDAVRRKFAVGVASVNAGGVGFRSEAALINSLSFGPSILDTSVEITKVIVRVASTGTVELVQTDAGISGFTNLTTKRFTDFRTLATPQSFVQSKNSAAATAGLVLLTDTLLANEPYLFDFRDDPLIIGGTNAQGTSLLVRPASDNVTFRVNFHWSEPADPV